MTYPSSVYQLNSHDNLRRIKKDLGDLGLSIRPQLGRCEIEVQECPYCPGDLSKPDNQFKLNINYEKSVFHCHRCGESGTYNKFRDQQGLMKSQPTIVDPELLPPWENIWRKTISLTAPDAEPARRYFANRGLLVPETDRIRFAESVKYYEQGTGEFYLPAIVSRVEDIAGNFVAVHQIFLDFEGNKANVLKKKKFLGKVGGGIVSFGTDQLEIAVAEGIETSLAVHQSTGLMTYSCLSSGGLKKFEPPASTKKIHIFADNDINKIGQTAAFDLANRLHRKKIEVYVHIPDRDQFDIGMHSSFDFLDVYNRSKEVMETLVKVASPYDPSKDFWVPPMRKEAFHGIVGKYLDRIFPFTEADRNALCVQFLILFGSMVGRKPYFQISSDRQFANLFAVIVGETSTGRKGTGLSNCKAFFKSFAEEFVKHNISDGLATGEGIIHRLRDPIEVDEPDGDKKNSDGSHVEAKKKFVDRGIEDKRLLISEPEFVQVISATSKPGSTLSGNLRKLWDCESLENLSKGAAETATDPFVSIIGQITPTELKKKMDAIDFSNGLGNRFMWIMSRSSKLIPLPPDLSKIDISDLAREVREALNHSQRIGPMKFAPEAEELWCENYIKRYNRHDGVLGSLTARYAPQVLRISMIYALLDRQSAIGLIHLKAGFAVWDYSQESTAFLFGGMPEDPVARKIHYNLEKSENGLTRTEIRDLFSGHKTSDEIEDALRSLKEQDLVDSRLEPTKGRSSERWYAI